MSPTKIKKKKPKIKPSQKDFFKTLLTDLIDASHPLVLLADTINWEVFDSVFEEQFVLEEAGRPPLPNRMMVGLLYLKYTHDLSDEQVLARWLENPYWQYFCGGTYFEHRLPIHPSSMTRWRTYLKETGAETMLSELIITGVRAGHIKESELRRVILDTTVQEKNVRHPTDSRLYNRMREKLVTAAKERGINLRQSYVRKGPNALQRISGYMRAQQYKRARKQTAKLKTYLGRVMRDIERKAKRPDKELRKLLSLTQTLLSNPTRGRDRIYSIHEPQVECIGKGKAHKKWEFGVKAGFAVTAKKCWIVGAKAFPGNPYDGHTLKKSLEQVSYITGQNAEHAYVDLGYRGHGYKGRCEVHIATRHRKRMPKSMKKWLKRRNAIEPVFGHAKQEHRMGRNRLKGVYGDKLNVILAACGYNMRKLLKMWAVSLYLYFVAPIVAVLAGKMEKLTLKKSQNLALAGQI